MKKLYSSGIVVYRATSGVCEYLILQYKHGHWGLPKGKLEAGETKQQAATRELQEETGLQATIIPGFEVTYEYNFVEVDGVPSHKIVSMFVGKADDGTITLSHEHIDHAWLPLAQAVERVNYQQAKELLKQADVFIKKGT